MSAVGRAADSDEHRYATLAPVVRYHAPCWIPGAVAGMCGFSVKNRDSNERPSTARASSSGLIAKSAASIAMANLTRGRTPDDPFHIEGDNPPPTGTHTAASSRRL